MAAGLLSPYAAEMMTALLADWPRDEVAPPRWPDEKIKRWMRRTGRIPAGDPRLIGLAESEVGVDGARSEDEQESAEAGSQDWVEAAGSPSQSQSGSQE